MPVKAGILLLSLLLTTLAISGPQSLEPTASQSRVMMDILDNLESGHYKKLAINDDFSTELYTVYLEALDSSKSHFLLSDIEQLSSWRTKLDDSLKKGNIDFGFEAFNRYRQIAIDQLRQNIELLESDYQFDLDDDEYLVVDVEERDWLRTDAERRDWWRKRMEDALLRLKLSGKELDNARELLVKRYTSQMTQLNETDERDVFQAYSNAVTMMYDPHTNYFSPRTSENFNINMSLSLEGIGAVLQRQDEHTSVVRVVPGGPADKQGELKAGDMIIGVAQGVDGENVDIIGWRLDDAVDLIRGPKSSTVVLQVIPAEAEAGGLPKPIQIVRDTVKLEEQAAQSQVIEVDHGDRTYRLGVIDIPTFYLDFEAYRNRDPDAKSTTRDVYRLLGELKKEKVDGVILDLRGNGGGSLQEATALTDLFIDPGPVVQIRNSRNHVDRRQQARRKAYYRGPLLVLIDRLSASASEIFAGAIQDYQRGLIVGTQSFGKGTVQSLLPLREGQLKMTEAKFYRVSGDSTQNRGVVPDIEFPSEHPLDEIGESKEDHALPWDNIRPVNHRKQEELSAAIPLLASLHRQRIEHDPNFIFLTERVALSEAIRQQSSKRISLNEAKRKQQKEERETAMMALENKRRVSKGLEPWADIKSWRDAQSEIDADTLPLGEKDPRLMEAGQILADLIGTDKNTPRYVKKEMNARP